MLQQTNDLGRWYPTSITIIVNGKEYKGYQAPMSLAFYTLELLRLYNLNYEHNKKCFWNRA